MTEAYCKKIQADDYGETAQDGVELALRFARQRHAAGTAAGPAVDA